jgi:hypothetical protein
MMDMSFDAESATIVWSVLDLNGKGVITKLELQQQRPME